MTKQELDYAHSKLNMEYTKKSNDINRRKDDVSREKLNQLLAIRMETAAKKDEIRTNIEMLRNERLKYERDTLLHNEISEKSASRRTASPGLRSRRILRPHKCMGMPTPHGYNSTMKPASFPNG